MSPFKSIMVLFFAPVLLVLWVACMGVTEAWGFLVRQVRRLCGAKQDSEHEGEA